MNKIYRNPSSGFSLIEIILYVAISAVVLLIMSQFLTQSLQARQKYKTVSEISMQGNQIMQLLAQTVRNASAINTPAAGATSSSLSLNVPTPALSPTVVSLTGGVLNITEGTGTGVALNNSQISVTNFTVRNLSRTGTPGIIQIQFTLSYNNPSNKNEYNYVQTFTTSAGIRR